MPKQKPQINILDSVHCKANAEARNLILPALKYKSTIWVKHHFGYKKPQIKTSYLITGRKQTGGSFLTGLLPTVLNYKENKKHIEIKGRSNLEIFQAKQEASLPGITFRKDQQKVFDIIKKKQRGLIVFPTGSGKTIIASGIISMFLPCRALFLCHTIDLLMQTEKEFSLFFGEKNLFTFGGGATANWEKVKNKQSCIVLSTIQSFISIPADQYSCFFDITIIDESHHVSSLTSQYGEVMLNNLSPRKYGLTATPPTKDKKILINKGLIGNVIAELTIDEGIKKKIIAKPKIKLLPVPVQETIKYKCKKSYIDSYDYGIVRNRSRNILILKEVIENEKKKESTLIVIEKTEHGKIIENILKRKKIKVKFVYGATDKKDRLKAKKDIQEKNIKTVICSRIWKEGINIPSLNNIILAFGLNDENSTLQTLGRGLRRDENKKTICLVDFLDPYSYIAEHAILRIQTYKKHGWI